MLESNGHSVESYESYFPSNLVLHYCCIMEIFLNRLSLNFSFETVINRIVYASTHIRAYVDTHVIRVNNAMCAWWICRV